MAEATLHELLPAVRRARGYRLYGHDGRRYLDLWQAGGRAILGHRAGRVTTVLKNVISTGLVADLPSVYTHRLERALQGFFPGYPAFRVTRSLAEALELASLFLGRRVSEADLLDPLEPGTRSAAEVALWRPLAESPPPARVLIPLLPFAMAAAPAVVGFAAALPAGFPASQPVSPVVLAGSLRALHELRRHEMPPWLTPRLLAGAAGWEQRGVYVLPRFPASRYPAVFTGFLEEGVVLNPAYPEPSVLPSEASGGELKKMIGLFRRFPGE